MGAPGGVRAEEHDEVVDIEPVGSEAGGELEEVERGRNWSAPLEVDMQPSQWPAGTMKLTPPLLRTALASQAAKARMSAQETLSEHAASSAALAASASTTKPQLGSFTRRGRGGRGGHHLRRRAGSPLAGAGSAGARSARAAARR